MTTTVAQAPRPDAAPLAADALIDRQELAEELATFIMGAESRLVVLHGPTASGKTALARTGIVPALRRAHRLVAYGECAPQVPTRLETSSGPATLAECIAGDGIILLDSFENVFDLPRDEGTAAMDALFGQLLSDHAGSRLVLIVDSRHLTAVYALSTYVPRIARAVRQLQPIGVTEGLRKLSRLDASGPAFSDELLARVEADVQQLVEHGWQQTVDLLKLVYDRLCAAAADGQQIDLSTYRQLGGLEGVLRSYLEERLERLNHESPRGAELACAVLERSLAARTSGASLALDELAARLAVERRQLDDVVRRLTTDPAVALLRQGENGAYELVPSQLGVVVAGRLERRRPDIDRAQRLVEEGLRSWQRLGVLMPRDRFAEIHALRADLEPDTDARRFLLRCAIGYGTGALADATAYWLGRIPDAAEGMELLLSALFDHDPAIRRRSAELLARYDDSEVRDRLFLLAVSDPDPDPAVRAQAIQTLGVVKDVALRARVMRVVADSGAAHRVEAIELMQIFADAEAVTKLGELVANVSTPVDARAMAIRVLSRVPRTDAVEVLLGVALEDTDAEDRREATQSLGTLNSEALNAHLLARLYEPTVLPRVRRVRVVLGVVAVVLGIVGAIVLALGMFFAPLALAALVLAMTVAGGTIVRRIRDGTTRARSLAGVAGVVAFVGSVLTLGLVLQGLAHALIGQWRRAVALFGYGVLGLILLGVGLLLIDSSSKLQEFYVGVGLLIMVLTIATDLSEALSTSVIFRRTLEVERRRTAVRRGALANPVAARAVVTDLASSTAAARERARAILLADGEAAHPDALVAALRRDNASTPGEVLQALTRHREESTIRLLEHMWHDADSAVREYISRIFWTRPSELSLEALDRLQGDMPRGARVRVRVARWVYRLSVWPRQSWYVAALLLPVFAFLVYHGWNATHNPVWSEIRDVRLPNKSLETQLSAVEKLIEYHRADAGVYFVKWLGDDDFRMAPALYTRVAVGAVTTLERSTRVRDGDRRILTATADSLNVMLRSNDSAAFELAVPALASLADFFDAPVAARAREHLRLYVRRNDESPLERREKVTGALAALPIADARPTLDSLLMLSQNAVASSMIRQHIEERALHAIEQIDPARRLDLGEPLLRTLKALRPETPTPRLLEAMRDLEQELATARTRDLPQCPQGDRQCLTRVEEIANANTAIADAPASREGYQLLVAAYDSAGFRDAARALETLRDRHPTIIWPRKELSTLYLEKFGPTDRQALRRSFDEAVAMRNLPDYRAQLDSSTWRVFEADFAEIALAAGEHDAMRRAASALLAVSQETRHRLNMALFRYIASTMGGDRAAAERDLGALAAVMKPLNADFYNGWSYPGTMAYIDFSPLPATMKRALKKLCRSGYWFESKEAEAILEENRRALEARYAGGGRRTGGE